MTKTTEENITNLPENLKSILTELEMTSTELAKQSGVSLATLSRILGGQVNPSLSHIIKISNVLGVSLDKLTGKPTFTSVEGGANNTPTTKVDHRTETDILASFEMHSSDRTPEEMARLLTNAANGYWVESWTDTLIEPEATSKVRPVSAMQVGTKRISVDLAFPHELVEAGSIVSLVSIIGTAVTGTGARIVDVRIPSTLMRTYKSPMFGVTGLRDVLNKYGRPLLSATMRPMNGLSPKMYGRSIYETLSGGVDITCDPTMMHSLPSNRWRERFRFAAEAQQSAEDDSNETKIHIANVSADTVEKMLERADYAKQCGLHAVMVDSAAIGWSALSSLSSWCRSNDIILASMGRRSLQRGVLTEQLISKLLRISGCDIVSIASPLSGSITNRRMIKGVVSALKDEDPAPSADNGILFDQPTCQTASAMPACGGGHNVWHFPRLIDAMGNDHIIQCGGSIMGHPKGIKAGARANRVAIEALIRAQAEGRNLTVEGRNILQEAAQHSPHLQQALDQWHEGSFLFGIVDGDKKGIQAVVQEDKK